MFKVISSAESKEIGEWEIQHVKSGEIVARIAESRFLASGKRKELYVKNKTVGVIKNQDEALVKLSEFFKEIQRNIDEESKNHSELLLNLNRVEGHYTYNLILNEIKIIEDRIKKLKEYSLE